MIPHILRALGTRPAFLAFERVFRIAYSEALAFVFPSFEMAQRYASAFSRHTGKVWMPVATPDRPTAIEADRLCRQCGCSDAFGCPGGCHWSEADLCSACAAPAPLVAWAIYDRPSDYPDGVIARRYVGDVPTTDTLTAPSIATVRAQLPAGLTRFEASRQDDPKLVETWVAS